MKANLNRAITFLMIFLLCANVNAILPLFLKDKTNNTWVDQTQSQLRTSTNPDLIFKVGVTTNHTAIDPVDAMDAPSFDVIGQVVETLFTYNLTDTNYPRINQLAESYWWKDSTTLQIQLKQGILFHDYTPFNATAAKWNFDRLLYLTNCTGTNMVKVASTRALWILPDGVTPIIASVSAIGEWNITITLNSPYAPFMELLCHINAGMLSPSSTPANNLIDLYSGQLFGTGPFKYQYFDPGNEVLFTRWDDYWKAPAYFEEMVFMIIPDQITRNDMMFTPELDYLMGYSTDYIPAFEAAPFITVKKFSEDTGRAGLPYYYLGFNNKLYNVTWRKAMSFAINCSYILDDLYNMPEITVAQRANSPISSGFGAVYNASVTAADFNITYARQIMQSMGLGDSFDIYSDTEWTNVADGPTPFLTTNFTYSSGDFLRQNLFSLLHNWYRLIGILVNENQVTYPEYLNMLYNNHDAFGLYYEGWVPDYLDPNSMLDPLFNPTSIWNVAQVNDPWLNSQLALAVTTMDTPTRQDLYKNIQWYMAEVGFFHAYVYHPSEIFVHRVEIQGVPYNAIGHFYAYPIYRAIPGPFTLTSDAGDPDEDGSFTLSWTASNLADNYSVYEYSGYIYEINDSLTLLADEITDLSLPLSGYGDGTYYFIVMAHNVLGDTLSNCFSVMVKIRYDHDLEVLLDTPITIKINTSYLINASVKNTGYNAESGVELFLYLDEVVIDSLTIPNLPVGANQTIQYVWTPTEYRAYNFTAYSPPVTSETRLDDNVNTIFAYVIDTKLFDGMYIKHYYTIPGATVITNFTYTPYTSRLYHEIWGVEVMGVYNTYTYIVDALTRITSGGSAFGDGTHTLGWIFATTSLYDYIPIAVYGTDHLFSVARDLVYDLPGFGPIEVWELEDLTQPGGIAWYEKSTGIFLNGTFFFIIGSNLYNYTFDFIDTNADLNILSLPENFTLSSNAEDPDDDGNFTLSWDSSDGADSYSVYQYSGLITKINGSLTLLADDITDLSLPLSGYGDGTYYFVVVAHNVLGDTLSNCISIVVEYPPPGEFTLSSNADDPDTDGAFSLSWTTSMYADNYSIYRYSSFITTINGSLTLIADEITDLNLPLSGYADGTYYFIVVAHNAYGDTHSNCLSVVVEHPPPGEFTLSSNADNPDTDGAFTLSWTSSMYADNYSVYHYSGPITTINGSLTLLADEITDLSKALSGYAAGTYYFVVVAHNAYGDTLSNYKVIVVQIQQGVPGYDLYFLLGVIFVVSVILIKKRVKKQK